MLRTLGVVANLLLALLGPLVVASIPGAGAPVAVVVSPWSSPARVVEVVAAADGRIVRGAAWPWIAIARSDLPDFAGELRRAGAWLVINPILLEGCLATTGEHS